MEPHLGWHHRDYLPHFDVPDRHHVITYRLGDALPARLPFDPTAITDDERRRRLEAILDRGMGSCVLRRDDSAEVVMEAWRHFHGERYDLCAWMIMPNHVHVLIRVRDGFPLPAIIHSWKSYTAKRINALIGTRGHLWQRDYWDRYIRDEEHYHAAVRYIHRNPVVANLCAEPRAWRWSSAWEESGIG